MIIGAGRRKLLEGGEGWQNPRSDGVCLDFFFVTFFCIKAKESKMLIAKRE